MKTPCLPDDLHPPCGPAGSAMPEQTRTAHLRASPPLFQSSMLDRLTRVHPAVPLILYGPAIAAMLAWSLTYTGMAGMAALAAGYVLWTLTEYWLHRVVFHLEPQNAIGSRLQHLIHGVHHEHPNDPRRLVMPPSASLPLAACVAALFYLALGVPYCVPLTAGYLTGYLLYDLLHYALHHGSARGGLARALRERHMRHHFQDHDLGFGVSAPYWDLLFGTSFEREAG